MKLFVNIIDSIRDAVKWFCLYVASCSHKFWFSMLHCKIGRISVAFDERERDIEKAEQKPNIYIGKNPWDKMTGARIPLLVRFCRFCLSV